MVSLVDDSMKTKLLARMAIAVLMTLALVASRRDLFASETGALAPKPQTLPRVKDLDAARAAATALRGARAGHHGDPQAWGLEISGPVLCRAEATSAATMACKTPSNAGWCGVCRWEVLDSACDDLPRTCVDCLEPPPTGPDAPGFLG